MGLIVLSKYINDLYPKELPAEAIVLLMIFFGSAAGFFSLITLFIDKYELECIYESVNDSICDAKDGIKDWWNSRPSNVDDHEEV